MPGVLYVVATPIGNLEDLTFRAKRILGSVRVIAAEDTRRTAKLLSHYDLHTPMISVREHNEAREAARIVERLRAGDDVALVSDAGTPGIADPGARVVKAVLESGLTVVPIPGASAVTAALSASGMDASQFVFLGFPPPKGQARQRWFEAAAAEPRTQVAFEAPHRIQRTLDELAKYVRKPIIIFRELSKIHETLVYKPTNDIPVSNVATLGEFVLVIGPAEATNRSEPDDKNVADVVASIERAYDRLHSDWSKDLETLVDVISKWLALDRRIVAKAVKKHEIYIKQQNK